MFTLLVIVKWLITSNIKENSFDTSFKTSHNTITPTLSQPTSITLVHGMIQQSFMAIDYEKW